MQTLNLYHFEATMLKFDIIDGNYQDDIEKLNANLVVLFHLIFCIK